MRYFVTGPIGLIIAFCNVTTFVLLVYLFLKVVAEGRSGLFRVLDRIFAPLLTPLRRALPDWRLDAAPIILALIFQLIAFALKRSYR